MVLAHTKYPDMIWGWERDEAFPVATWMQGPHSEGQERDNVNPSTSCAHCQKVVPSMFNLLVQIQFEWY